MAEEEKLKPKQKPHYVDNKKFLAAMTEYRALRIKAEEEEIRRQQISRAVFSRPGIRVNNLVEKVE